MIIYVHPNGQGDFRIPTPIVQIGPEFSRCGDMVFFSMGMSDKEIREYPGYGYQQLQIGAT